MMRKTIFSAQSPSHALIFTPRERVMNTAESIVPLSLSFSFFFFFLGDQDFRAEIHKDPVRAATGGDRHRYVTQ